ncbi:unnamed protein product [Prorocentrum cordatum]|uniref:Uncharacterized protein n=1 Tax=Prorocentrum cordatum TaxID=2364126 RepID=A0ABN9WJ93_9DINO|nr:unnamed protein product [Polarella glacialis]
MAWVRAKKELERCERLLRETTEEVVEAEKAEVETAKRFLPKDAIPEPGGPAILDAQQVLAGNIDLKVSFGKEFDDVQLNHPDTDTLERAQASLQEVLPKAVQESYGTIAAKLQECQEGAAVVEREGNKRKGNDGGSVDRPPQPAAVVPGQPAAASAPPPAASGGACGAAGGPYAEPPSATAAPAVDEATVRLQAKFGAMVSGIRNEAKKHL